MPKQTLLRHGLRLCEINLLVLPDWSAPRETVASELRAVLRGILLHPAAPRTTMLFKVADDETGQLLVRNANELLRPAGCRLATARPFGIGPYFAPEEWVTLLSLVQRRVVLPHEDLAALERVGPRCCRRLPSRIC